MCKLSSFWITNPRDPPNRKNKIKKVNSNYISKKLDITVLMKNILRSYIIFQTKSNDENIFYRRKCICTRTVSQKQHFLETLTKHKWTNEYHRNLKIRFMTITHIRNILWFYKPTSIYYCFRFHSEVVFYITF